MGPSSALGLKQASCGPVSSKMHRGSGLPFSELHHILCSWGCSPGFCLKIIYLCVFAILNVHSLPRLCFFIAYSYSGFYNASSSFFHTYILMLPFPFMLNFCSHSTVFAAVFLIIRLKWKIPTHLYIVTLGVGVLHVNLKITFLFKQVKSCDFIFWASLFKAVLT